MHPSVQKIWSVPHNRLYLCVGGSIFDARLCKRYILGMVHRLPMIYSHWIVRIIHAYRTRESRSVILLGNHTKPASSRRRFYQDETQFGPLIILRPETYITGVDGAKVVFFFFAMHLRWGHVPNTPVRLQHSSKSPILTKRHHLNSSFLVLLLAGPFLPQTSVFFWRRLIITPSDDVQRVYQSYIRLRTK